MANLFPSASAITAVGGTVSFFGNKEIHKFTSSGFFNVTGTGTVEVLVVAGGGGTGGVGAQPYKGAGGGGGLYYNATFPVTTGSYTVTIGAGGAPNSNGGNSVFGSITALGGGKGGDCTVGAGTPPNIAPGSGGSGGGGGHVTAETCGSPGGTGTVGQGKNGGAGSASGGIATGGGGGGAGVAGSAGAGSGGAGSGGNGLAYNFNGTAYYYAGGGGGGGETSGKGAAGGLGGGGNGFNYIGTSIALNGAANRGGGAGGGGGVASGGSGVVIVSFTTSTRPDSVTDLTASNIQMTSLDLSWSTPNLHSLTCTGYQINYTTPNGVPTTILINNTGTCTTSYSVTGLVLGTDYSFRTSVWTPAGGNVTHANILNVTTLAFNPSNYTIGSFDFDTNNPVLFPIRYERSDTNSTTTQVNIKYDNTISLACDLRYTYAGTNHTYHGLTGTPISLSEDQTTFTFINATNEITTFHCWNENGNQTANYVLTQTDFLLLQQVRDFRNGTFGTQGQLGAFDFITLIIVIISMIGLNRQNEIVGAIFCIIAISVLAFFGIIQWYIALIAGLAVIIMLSTGATKKD